MTVPPECRASWVTVTYVELSQVIVGGKMAFTFLAAIGVQFHESQVELGLIEARLQCHVYLLELYRERSVFVAFTEWRFPRFGQDCKRMMSKAAARGVRLQLPIDVVVTDSLEARIPFRL